MSAIGAVLARPRWFVLAVLMAALIPGSVALGFWQLDRLEGRRVTNAVWENRLELDPVPIDVIRSNAGSVGAEDLRYLRVTVSGEYLPEQQVLVRGRAHDGVSGHWVVTPLVTEDLETVAVLRGWVPFALADPDDVGLLAPSGVVVVTGVLVPGERSTGFGPIDPPDGRLSRMALLDLERLGQQVGSDLGPVYVQQTTSAAGDRDELPVPVDLPDVTDEGPHLAYAIQWFSFAAIGGAGFAALLRREVRAQRKETDRVPIDSQPETR